MKNYWKQVLWIGGIYWIISLAFKLANNDWAYLIDAGLSLLLFISLLPMIWLHPVKRIEEAIKKTPVLSTLFVSVGWLPYFSGLMFLIGSVASFILFNPEAVDNLYNLGSLIWFMIAADKLRNWLLGLSVVVAIVAVVFFKKSVAGCLDKRFKLVGGNACDLQNAGEAAKASAKMMYECKEKAAAVKKAKIKKAKAPVKKAAEKKAPVKAAPKKQPKKTKEK